MVAPHAQALASYFSPLQDQLQLQALKQAERPTELTELADSIRRKLRS